jgi:probable phosphoglycerate mutase
MEHFTVYADGGARGNPGPAGSGSVVERVTPSGRELVAEISEFVGTTTNNVAEYRALIFGLEAVRRTAEEPRVHVAVFLDSQLIVEQMNGNYRVKHPGLLPLYARARSLVEQLGSAVTFTHVPRAKNAHADRLVNQAIDGALARHHA